METTKRWYQSKTVWAGVVAVLLAAYNAVSVQFGTPPVPEFVYAILGAIGIYGRTQATTKIDSGN